MVLTLPESSERILDELYSILQDKELCRIATAESGLLQLTVSYQTRDCAPLQGSLSPAPCLSLPCFPDWKPGAGQGQSWGRGLG